MNYKTDAITKAAGLDFFFARSTPKQMRNRLNFQFIARLVLEKIPNNKQKISLFFLSRASLKSTFSLRVTEVGETYA